MKKIIFLIIMFIACTLHAQDSAKVSELAEATSLNDADLFYLVQSSTSKKLVFSTLKSELTADIFGSGSVSWAKLAQAVKDSIAEAGGVPADSSLNLVQLEAILIEDEARHTDVDTFTVWYGYTFTDPQVILTDKNPWGTHIYAKYTNRVILQNDAFGVGDSSKTDILVIEK